MVQIHAKVNGNRPGHVVKLRLRSRRRRRSKRQCRVGKSAEPLVRSIDTKAEEEEEEGEEEAEGEGKEEEEEKVKT